MIINLGLGAMGIWKDLLLLFMYNSFSRKAMCGLTERRKPKKGDVLAKVYEILILVGEERYPLKYGMYQCTLKSTSVYDIHKNTTL